MAEVNYFNDIPDQPIVGTTGVISGLNYLDKVSAIRVGAGTRSFKADESGIWLGANKFADAPFRVGMDGSGYFSGNLSAGTIDIGGADATSFHVDVDGNMWLGASTYASAPMKVSNAGSLVATSVTLKDSGGTSFIDSTGVISATTFVSNLVTNTTTRGLTQNGSNLVDIPNTSLTFSLSRTTVVKIDATFQSQFSSITTSTVGSTTFINVDGTLYDPRIQIEDCQMGTGGYSRKWTLTSGVTASLASGSHTVKLQTVWTLDASLVYTVYSSTVNYTKLGT